MGIEQEFLQLMPDTVTVYRSTGTDEYGKRAFSSAGLTIRGHSQDATNVRTGQAGRSSNVIGQFYCFGVPAVGENDKMVLSDGTVVQIIAVDVANDENGPHHTVIKFGDASTGGTGMM